MNRRDALKGGVVATLVVTAATPALSSHGLDDDIAGILEVIHPKITPCIFPVLCSKRTKLHDWS